jgi:AcrR family transcriptional regulator
MTGQPLPTDAPGRVASDRGTTSVKAASTRDRILAAAAHLLSRLGYAETTLSGIAGQAGLRPPAIYYYFPSREELVAEVMETGQRLLREHVESALLATPAGATPMDRIGVAVAAHLSVELHLSDFATAVTRNAGVLPAEIRDRLRDEGRVYLTLWNELLHAAHAAGAVRDDLDLPAARMLVIGALNWTAEWWNPDHGSLTDLIRTAQSLVRHGLSS